MSYYKSVIFAINVISNLVFIICFFIYMKNLVYEKQILDKMFYVILILTLLISIFFPDSGIRFCKR